MSDPKAEALHQLRVRAAGIAAMRSVVQELEGSSDPSRSRTRDLQHLQSALVDSLELFVREMHDATTVERRLVPGSFAVGAACADDARAICVPLG